jgi:hypothetical protein
MSAGAAVVAIGHAVNTAAKTASQIGSASTRSVAADLAVATFVSTSTAVVAVRLTVHVAVFAELRQQFANALSS